MTHRPHPKDFDAYQAYLQAMIEHLRATQKNFTFRQFSKRAGFSSPNFLKLVADGKRKLSVDSIGRFAKGLQLSPVEHDAFENLVLLNQAKTDEERNRYFAKHTAGRARTAAKRLEKDQYEVYSAWFVLPILEMMRLPTFREDAGWIARHLRPTITTAQAKRALKLLERVGLTTRRSGKLVPVEDELETPAVVPLAVRNYHRAMMDVAMNSLDGLSKEERNISSLTVRMSPETYDEVCQRVERFREELMSYLDTKKPSKEDEIQIIGFQVVPVTEIRKA